MRQAGGTLGAPVTVPVTGGGADNSHGDVRLADLNGDRRADLIVAGLTRVVVRLAGANGTFGPEVLVATGQVEQVEVGDITGDRRPDVVVRQGYWQVRAYAQGTTGAFTLAWQRDVAYGRPVDVSAIALGDVTGDGVLDLAAAGGGNIPDARLIVYPSAGTVPVAYTAYDVPGALVLADMERDGRVDAVIGHYGWGEFTVSRQNAYGRLGAYWGTQVPTWGGSDFRAMSVGDLTGDGRPDVLIADHNTGLILAPQAP